MEREQVKPIRASVPFFFFQAEDGIRDKLVTGVQTCALPISECHESNAMPDHEPQSSSGRDESAGPGKFSRRVFLSHLGTTGLVAGSMSLSRTYARSEERRVGKERRPRRSSHPTTTTVPHAA